MQKILLMLLTLSLISIVAEELKPWTTKLNNLTTFEKHVLIDKGTERAFSGKYVHTDDEGIYTCKVCDASLYTSEDKFDSHCGWPSFD